MTTNSARRNSPVWTGIAIEVAIDGHFDTDAHVDPDTGAGIGISRCQSYFRNRS